MSSGEAAMERLHARLAELRAEWYAAGRGDEFEEHVARFQREGRWPFDA
ncbi:MAG: hypothetical protein ACTHJL_09765 [Amnibacterium sp.]